MMKDNPDGALPLFIGGGDRFAVRGCEKHLKLYQNPNVI